MVIAAAKPLASGVTVTLVEQPESAVRVHDDFGAFFAAPVPTKDPDALLRSKVTESAGPENTGRGKPAEEKTNVSPESTFFPPKSITAHHDREPELSAFDRPFPAPKAEQTPANQMLVSTTRLGHDTARSNRPVQQLHLAGQLRSDTVTEQRIDHHLSSVTKSDVVNITPKTVLTEVQDIKGDTHPAAHWPMVENRSLLISGTKIDLKAPAQGRSAPENIQNLKHREFADGMSLPSQDLKSWSTDSATAPKQTGNAMNQVNESFQEVLHVKSVEHVAMQVYPRADLETSFALSLHQAIPVAFAQQAVPATSLQQPAPAASLRQPAPAASLQQPAPATSLQQPAPAASLQQPAPAASLQQPAPTTSLQQPAPAASLHKPAPATSLQQAISARHMQQNVVTPLQDTELLRPERSGAAVTSPARDKLSLGAVESRVQNVASQADNSMQSLNGALGGTRAPTKQIELAEFTASKPANTTNSDSLVSLLSPSDSFETTSWEAPRAQHAHPASSVSARAEIVPHIAKQLVEVMGQAAHRPTEIALSPEELGRVRMSMVAEDGKITVSILTERPETLDLMRRHIEQLGQSFRSMGYDQVSFSFGLGAQTGDQSSGNPSKNTSSEPSQTGTTGSGTETGVNTVNLDSTPSTGIDIRL